METPILMLQDSKSELIAEGIDDIRRRRILTWIALSLYIPVVLLGANAPGAGTAFIRLAFGTIHGHKSVFTANYL